MWYADACPGALDRSKPLAKQLKVSAHCARTLPGLPQDWNSTHRRHGCAHTRDKHWCVHPFLSHQASQHAALQPQSCKARILWSILAPVHSWHAVACSTLQCCSTGRLSEPLSRSRLNQLIHYDTQPTCGCLPGLAPSPDAPARCDQCAAVCRHRDRAAVRGRQRRVV